MKKHTLALLFFWAVACASAQVVQPLSQSSNMFQRPAPLAQLPGPSHMEEYVVNGKLRLSIEDALLLALLNNSDVNVDRAQFDIARFAVQRAHSPFDPVLTAGFAPTRSVFPSTSSLIGASTLSTLNQNSTVGFSQLFETGTALGVGFNTTRLTTNSSFATVNPSFNSGLTFSLSQPLWRKAGLFVNRAPIVIAQRSIKQSQAMFAAQLNETVARIIGEYWDVVQAAESVDVLRKSQERAEASYQHDKRALELGALSPLEIYRSESKVAQRKIAVLQAEYSLKRAQDAFRQALGADLDARAGALDLELTDKAEAPGALAAIDLQDALAQAVKNRPELEAQRQQLSIDDDTVRLASNNLRPDVNLSATYGTSGVGGTVFDRNGALLSAGGFTDSLAQLGGFGFPTYGVSLQLRLPVRNNAAAADLGTALVTKKRALYQMRSLQQNVGIDVKNAVHDLELAELLMAASQSSRDLTAKTLATEERKYELGAQTIFFVLDAQDQLAQAEQALLQSQIAYRKALAGVDRATGQLLEKHKLEVK
ncbi:MAG TPA: TolC family protein [Candidatus Saccharimonadales bacterium]|nr:TolC family protein [Candidatus Saccharimonadales bacterium]